MKVRFLHCLLKFIHMKSHNGIITELDEDEVFVFGSNLQGIHGKGAAKTAKRWGAKHRLGEGLSEKTYAFPTVYTLHPYRVIPLSAYGRHIKNLIGCVEEYPYKIFYITALGCGLAGNKDKDVAPLFEPVAKYENVYVTSQWKRYLPKARPF